LAGRGDITITRYFLSKIELSMLNLSS